MGFETQRNRGTQRSDGSATQSCQVASKVVVFHLGNRGSPNRSPTPQRPLPHTRLTPNAQRSAENCPHRAKAGIGGQVAIV
jgi:hypothetical protein